MTRRPVISIGNFDGVHLGHQAILRRARALARQHGGYVLALTFDPLPIEKLRPGHRPMRLLDMPDRLALLRQHGADQVQVIEPTAEFLGRDPDVFVQNLVSEFNPIGVVEGENFRFGKERVGDMQLLTQLGEQYDFQVQVEPTLKQNLSDMMTVDVSSTLIRRLVRLGRVWDVRTCMGRPYTLQSHIVEGEHRGRTLGVPTANLKMDLLADRVIPKSGVYAGIATLADGSATAAAISVGPKPTFGLTRIAVEAHLLQWDADLYGQTLELSFTRWLRGQYAFPTVADLRDQLQRDIQQTQHLHQAG